MKRLSLGTIVAGASCALFVACAGGPGDVLSPTSASWVLTPAQNIGDPGNGVVNQAEVEVCVNGAAAKVDVVINGGQTVTYSFAAGECKVVDLNFAQTQGGSDNVSVSEQSSPFFTVLSRKKTELAFIVGTPNDDQPVTSTPNSDPVTTIINGFHGTLIEYTNHPLPEVCDFITFGKLVAYLNGQKVVISGNIGGNQPGGGILSEFHVEANGVDNHVANVDTYGAIGSGPLSGLTNSRISTGIAKNGVAVEVRMWDGGEPGKGTDIVYVKLNGVEILGPNGQYLDQGNMQYHSNCRGPG